MFVLREEAAIPVSGPYLWVIRAHRENLTFLAPADRASLRRRTVVTDEGVVFAGWAIDEVGGVRLAKSMIFSSEVARGRETHFATCPGAVRHRRRGR